MNPKHPMKQQQHHGWKSNENIELKPLLSNLRYEFLRPNSIYPVIVSYHLNRKEVNKLLEVLRRYKHVIDYIIDDLKGIHPSICMHRILLVEDHKPLRQGQCRLNPNIKEVVKKEVMKNEVIKLLDEGIIYPISDSTWVSPTQVVLKNWGMTIVPNDTNELIPIK